MTKEQNSTGAIRNALNKTNPELKGFYADKALAIMGTSLSKSFKNIITTFKNVKLEAIKEGYTPLRSTIAATRLSAGMLAGLSMRTLTKIVPLVEKA